MMRGKVMGIAIASGKVGHVVMRKGILLDWKVSKQAARSPEQLQKTVEGWITLHRPDRIVTEAINPYCRKSPRTLHLMQTLEEVITQYKIPVSYTHLTLPTIYSV